MLRTTTLWGAGIATRFWTTRSLWSTLCSFSCSACFSFCFALQARFFLCLTASGFFTFLSTACIFFGATLSFFSCANTIFRITNQRTFECAATCIHFGARQRVQNHARAIRLARTL